MEQHSGTKMFPEQQPAPRPTVREFIDLMHSVWGEEERLSILKSRGIPYQKFVFTERHGNSFTSSDGNPPHYFFGLDHERDEFFRQATSQHIGTVVRYGDELWVVVDAESIPESSKAEVTLVSVEELRKE